MNDEDSSLDHAISTMRRWYYTAIRRIVDDAIEACIGKIRCADPGVESIARDAEKSDRQADADKIRASNPTERYNRERGDGVDAREFLTERIDESTDSHQITTYTMQAKCALLASDNEDAYQDEFGEPAPTVEAAACMAMRRDAWELLEPRSDEWEPRDCDDCCTTLDASIVDSVSDEHDENCSLHPTGPAIVNDNDAPVSEVDA